MQTLAALADVVERIIERLSDTEYNGLYLIDPADGRLRLLYARNFTAQERVEAERTAWDRHPGWVVRNKRMFRVDDMANAAPATLRPESPRSFTVRSRVWLPITYNDECVGTFGLASLRPYAFTDWDIQLVGFVCNLTGVAYQRIVEEGRRRDAEARLQQSRAEALAARRATVLKDQFVAMVSHELRTPLTAVMGFGELLRRSPHAPRQRDYIDKILRGSQQLLGLINDILDLSKIEAGGVVIERAPFELERLLRNVCDGAAMRAAERHLEFVVDVAPELPARVVGDSLRLQQVLTNLVGNAVKFTERGEVCVTVSARPAADGGDDAWTFTVRDTGIGISADAQTRLFQPFSQADQSTTRRFGGTGLGLTISRRLAELMGGKIDLESRVAEGSTFSCTVPLGRPAELSPPPRVDDALRGARAVIVHGHPSARDAIARCARTIGFDAEAPETVDDACARLADADAALCLVDDGLAPDALRAVMAALAGRTAKVLRVSRVARDEATLEALADAPALLSPVTPGQLLDAVASLFGGTRTALLPPPPAPAAPIHAARVLVVEDNEANQELLVELLGQVGVEPQLAGNGLEALTALDAAHAHGRPFHIVLMDLEMPVLDGLATARRIRADGRFAALPVFVMSAHALALDASSRALEHFNGALAKPLDPAQFYALVAAHVPAAARAPSPRPVAFTRSPAIDGVDLARLTARLGGDAGAARRVLARFEATAAPLAERLRAAHAAHDREALRASAHQLAGAAANLCLDDVAARAERLQHAARTAPDDERDALAGALLEALARSSAALRAWLDGSRDAPPDAPDRLRDDARDAALADLRARVDTADFDALAAFRALAPTLAAQGRGAEVAALGAALDAFDFEAASAILDAMGTAN